MRFLYPEYLKLLFLLAGLLPLWLYSLYTKRRTRLGMGPALRRISYLSSPGRESARYLLLNLVLASLILALAHPQWEREKSVAQLQKMDMVFLLDASLSMRAQDVWPSRLERALEVIGNFSWNKPPRDRIGLISFSSTSLILSYLTEDPGNILYYLDYLKEEKAPGFGTNIGRALKSGLALLAKEQEVDPQASRRKRIFILISDGEDHGQELGPSLEEVKRLGVRVHTIGIGSEQGAPIPIAWEEGVLRYVEDEEGNRILTRMDERTLSRVAEESGGNSYRSSTGAALEGTFAEIVLKEREIEGFQKVIEHEDGYEAFLLAAFGIFLVALLL